MKSLPLILLGSALALGGCAGTLPAIDTSNINTTIAAVRSATQTACHFLPTISTVANLLTAGSAVTQSIEGIASMICSAVSTQGLRRGARRGAVAPPVVTVNGKAIAIHGRFL